MNKYLTRNTNNLLKICAFLSKNNNVKVVPIPATAFKNLEELTIYNNTLINLIRSPELFYLVEDKLHNSNIIKLVDNNPPPTICSKYFDSCI